MGFFGSIFGGGAGARDINTCLAEAHDVRGAVVLDVREADEFTSGHVAGAINVPVGSISGAKRVVPRTDTPVYVYCLSGARASSAVSSLARMGYTNVVNAGGINRWRGDVVRGA
jgi:rhodanese-related sulfurtransferase